ncbi:hypothetical protein F2Q69_00033783 [Brassica cretica]|uniref:Gnk2-homologous domain-containing protein n=1 Tax=Brassica cretica TaxID=69181 RepID=A0A8S9SS95_BRACR|nr:hypothetical protein F2Q69_00033783 [Brassica cretica]
MTNNKSFLFSIILCFLLTIKTNVILVSAQDQQCLAKGSFNTNSTFNKNRLLVLSSLPSNVTAQNNFFYNSSLGQDRDKIYALAMCIPDTETEDCSNCYIAQGRFSVKTDVYSYGIMVLEIICGRKNNSFQPSGVALHAWTNWRGDRALDIVDSVITENVSRNEMMKCINIGLLCVQESVTRRPNMNSVVHWLKSNSVTLPVPSTPAYVVHSESGEASRVSQSTVNVSITELEPR